MGQHIIPIDDLVISSGLTDSNILLATRDFRDADSITIFAPDTLPETVTVQVDSAETAVNFNPLTRGAPPGTDVTVPVGKAVTIELISVKAIKLVAGVAVAATRTFKVNKSFWV